MLDNGAAFCRKCAPAGDSDGEAIRRLQDAAGLNGGAAAVKPVSRLPLNGAAGKLVGTWTARDFDGRELAKHRRYDLRTAVKTSRGRRAPSPKSCRCTAPSTTAAAT